MRVLGTIPLALLFGGCVARPDRVIVGHEDFLRQYAETRRFSAGYPTSISVVPDGSAVLFLRSGPRSPVQDLYQFDTALGTETLLLTAEQVLRGAEEKLTPEELAIRERKRLSARGITGYRMNRDGSKLLIPLTGRMFIVERLTGRVVELPGDGGVPMEARFSPDGKYVSCVRDGELHIIELAGGQERSLTNSAGDTVTNGLSEFIAQEEMDRFEGYWWAPDSAAIAYQQTDTSAMEVMHIADATHPEGSPQSWRYPRPGRENAAVRLGIVPAQGGDTTWVSWDAQKYPYLATVRWDEHGPLTLVVQNRTQTEEAVLTVEPKTGTASVVLIEKDDAWLNIDQSMPRWLPDSRGFLWTTERGGARQLELRGRDGRLISARTPLDFCYGGFVHLDADANEALILGCDPPTETHVYRVAMNRSPVRPVQITTQPGIHGATFAEEHRVYVETSSTLDGRRAQIVRLRDGSEIGRLTSAAEEPPFIPGIELTTVGTGPQFHCVIIRPRGFESRRRYPVIVSVYGGPHSQMVRASPRQYLLQQWIADQGFIVVSIDGRGTPSRGRDWERIIKGNLIDVALNDQVAGVQALGRRYREMDLDRVGIYGWSFGGYFSAMAVMRRPDVFHVGVAGAPVADWRDYDTHYTERYLGLPQDNPDGYDRSSVLSYAADLTRPLLIIHGTADDNVYFAHSLKMSDALFRAGKEHQFLPLSGFTHMVPDPMVTERLYERITGFFEEHLLPKR